MTSAKNRLRQLDLIFSAAIHARLYAVNGMPEDKVHAELRTLISLAGHYLDGSCAEAKAQAESERSEAQKTPKMKMKWQ